MELRRAANPTARFLKLSYMMQEALLELNYCLNEPLAAMNEKNKSPKADVVSLFGTSADKPYPSKH